jgi:glycosyltransferase involved in cell wall biosynthesis
LDFIVTINSQQYSLENMKNSKSNAPPLVSWILCTHVGGVLLHKAITSCLGQTYSDFELILVINGNHTFAIKEELKGWDIYNDPRLRIYETEVKNLTFSLSLGLHNARGKYIARMDGDDIAYPHRLSMQVEFLEKNPDISVLGSAFEIIDLEGNPMLVVSHALSDSNIRQALIFKNPICHPTVMFKREVILEAGGYLGGCHSEDYDLWVRLSLSPKIKFANLSEICLGYRSVGVGVARKSREAYASMAGSQLRSFLITGKIRWFLATLISFIKITLILFGNLVNFHLFNKIKIKKDR